MMLDAGYYKKLNGGSPGGDPPLLFVLYLIIGLVPNKIQNKPHSQENKSCHNDMTVTSLFDLLHFTGTVITISFPLGSSHGNKRKNNIAHNEAYADQCTLRGYKHETCKQSHHNPRNEECIG